MKVSSQGSKNIFHTGILKEGGGGEGRGKRRYLLGYQCSLSGTELPRNKGEGEQEGGGGNEGIGEGGRRRNKSVGSLLKSAWH